MSLSESDKEVELQNSDQGISGEIRQEIEIVQHVEEIDVEGDVGETEDGNPIQALRVTKKELEWQNFRARYFIPPTRVATLPSDVSKSLILEMRLCQEVENLLNPVAEYCFSLQ
ncbi:hypothetical protein FQA39_LY00546 [Lamprigera yunnana]|nr:hypothetical protein FQA39_LY00546 [Lamprigera yunnana]